MNNNNGNNRRPDQRRPAHNKNNTENHNKQNAKKPQQRRSVPENGPKVTQNRSLRARNRLIVLGVAVALLIALGIGIGVVINAIVNPKAPDNGAADETLPFSTKPVAPPETEGDGTQPAETDDEPVDVPPVEEKGKMYNFLLLGRDKVALNTDVIMIINFNADSGKIAVMQIPRDTYVVINNTGYKLNSVYGHFYNEGKAKNEKDPEDYGLKQLSSLLEANLCINIQNYAMVNLEGFRNIVDILGGVEVDIPADMKYVDGDQGLVIDLKKGKQVLNGEKAEMFVRFRSGYIQADIGRMDAQKIFMSALLKEVKDHFNITTVVKMAAEVFKNVKTDMSLNDINYFAQKLIDIDLNNMSFMTVSGYSPTPPQGQVWYYVINRRGTINLINQYFNIYDFEITDGIFDPNRIFTSTTTASYLHPYYIADPSTVIGGDVNNADDINQGAIDIPRT